VQAYGLDPEGVYLMGFSQGAIMSMSLTLTEPEKLAGVVAMSGRTLPEVLPKIAQPEKLRGLPIFVVHGTADQVLPITYGRDTRDILSKMPVDLTYREYPMAHHVSAESLADVAGWLKDRLDSKE
ncbi:MAG: dienelactone hydrolase family protein, partial [Chloroflexia bacterium]